MPDPNNIALPDFDLVFMLNAKVASCSIKISILEAMDLPTDRPHDTSLLSYVTKEEAREFKKRVAFVRDPVERLLSCYYDKIANKAAGRYIAAFDKFSLHEGMPFIEFVDAICCVPDEDANHHFRSQAYSLMEDGKVIPNYIWNINSLPNCWENVQKLLPGLGPIGVHNSSRNKDVEVKGIVRSKIVHRFLKDYQLPGIDANYKYQINPDRVKPSSFDRTICDVHRDVYRIARDQLDGISSIDIMALMAEAFDMGKRMNARLIESKK